MKKLVLFFNILLFIVIIILGANKVINSIMKKPVESKIITIKTMNNLIKTIDELLKKYKGEEILTIFDIDMTLTQPDHPATFYPTLKKYNDIFNEIIGDLTSEQKDLVATLTIFFPAKLVEDCTPKIIKYIQKKGIPTIAFTAALTGKLTTELNITNELVENLRYHSLNNFGINFKNSFPERTIVFKNIPAYNNHYPVFLNGILYANGEKGKYKKGAVLVEFLKEIAVSPKVLIFIDDKKKNIDNVEEHLKNHFPGIKFVGINYQGSFAYVHKDMITAEKFKNFWKDLANRAKALHTKNSH